jgi:uncharacterized protein YcbX
MVEKDKRKADAISDSVPKKQRLVDFHSQSPVSLAEYASVKVLEQTVNRVLLMKRVRDNKVNARHILHLANVQYQLTNSCPRRKELQS